MAASGSRPIGISIASKVSGWRIRSCEALNGARGGTHRLLALLREDAERLRELDRAAANALRVFDALRERPLATVNALAERTGASYPTVARAIDALEGLGIVSEITGRKRERVFAYRGYLDVLNEGTEPL